MKAVEMKNTLARCYKYYGSSGSPVLDLLRLIVEELTKDLPNYEEEYLTAEEFCNKYPFMSPICLTNFSKFCSLFRLNCCKKDGKIILYNPKSVFKYIDLNSRSHPRYHKRLKESSFFGINIQD